VKDKVTKAILNHAEVSDWAERLRLRRSLIAEAIPLTVEGRITRIVGLTLEAVGCQAAIGSRCFVMNSPDSYIEAEVVGFSGESTFLMPTGSIHGLLPNARVIPGELVYGVPVGDALLGRVIDGSGCPIDGAGPIPTTSHVSLNGKMINPLSRQSIDKPLDVGIRAINSLLTVGRGQRLGLFAGSGVGKSVLLGMMTRFTNADVIVVGLIGERGREVKEFIEGILGKEGIKRAVVVATPADNPPLLRLHGALLATSIAEYFRDQGKHVLLLMDSLTRFAQAQREIGLAIGEPPTTKGYPPSVFAKLPQLVERAGNGSLNKGSITGLYTVLTEGDDQQDPVADAARAVLDGHIVLSRRLSEGGHYPAIDVEASISRSMTNIVNNDHLQYARKFRELNAIYQQNRDLISVGAYTRGSEASIDKAIDFNQRMMEFLRQASNQPVSFSESFQQLKALMHGV
jgi:flagellum-specific ATP synthase